MKDKGIQEKKFIIMTRLGLDLHTLHKMCGVRFSFKTSI